MELASTPSYRGQTLAQADPRYRISHYSARSDSVARPLDLLGAPPSKDLAFITEAARALMSAEAAQLALNPPPPVLSGLGIDVRG